MSASKSAAGWAVIFTGAASLALVFGDPMSAGVLGFIAVALLGLAAWVRHRERAERRKQARRARYARVRVTWEPAPCLTGLSDDEEAVLDQPGTDPQALRKLVWGSPSIEDERERAR